MQYIHDNKPPVSSGHASLYIDLIFWHPKEKNALALTQFLEKYGLGERSQTVEWLDKFTVRISMWRRKYLYNLSSDEWAKASQDLMAFIRDTATHYAIKKIEYDTRAFSVGLAEKVRREHRPLEALAQVRPAHEHPVWWVLKV